MPTKTDKPFCCFDNGLFPHIAEMLARESKTEVGYYKPWEDAFPSSEGLMIGDGFKGVDRVKYFWPNLTDYETFVFTDLYHPDKQEFLRSIGLNVWGAAWAETLETDRVMCRELFTKLGMPVAKWDVVVGIDDLRKYLKSNKEVFVKPMLRGDFETQHCESYEIVERWLDELAHSLGDKKDYEVFMVEHGIEAEVEVGFDGYFVNGWPATGIVGYEIKDCGYIGCALPYDQLSKHIRYCNHAIEPWLKEHDMRGFMSTEIRVTKEGEPYLIDPCMRCGFPCSEGYAEMFANWPEIITEGAKGGMVNPEVVAPYACELVIYSDWGRDNWLDVIVPKEVRQYVKLNFACQLDKKYVRIPLKKGMAQCGAVVGLGNTIQEAVEMANDIRKEVKGLDVKFDLGSIDSALAQIKAGQKLGIDFGKSDVPDHIDL